MHRAPSYQLQQPLHLWYLYPVRPTRAKLLVGLLLWRQSSRYVPGQCTAIPPATVTASLDTRVIYWSSCAATIGGGFSPNGWQCGYISLTQTGGLGTSTMTSYSLPIRPTSVIGTITSLNSTVGITGAPLPVSSNAGGNMIKVRIFWMLVIALLFHSAVVIRC